MMPSKPKSAFKYTPTEIQKGKTRLTVNAKYTTHEFTKQKHWHVAVCGFIWAPLKLIRCPERKSENVAHSSERF